MSTSTGHDSMVVDTLAKIFDEYAGAEQRQRAEQDGWMPELWAVLAGSGLPWVGVPESVGGVGGTPMDIADLLLVAGRHAVPLPLAESCGLLGGWLVSEAELSMPDSPVSVPIPRPSDRLSVNPKTNRVTGRLHRVPWGRHVSAVITVADRGDGDVVVLVDPGEATVQAGASVAGEPRDSLTFDDAAVLQMGAVAAGVREELRMRGALSRTLLMAGAMEAIAELTIRYSSEREQFGRPVGRFQAVAQRLARLSCETEAAALSAAVAARRFAESGTDAVFEVAAAKATVGRAADEVTTHAHQIHGAIGMSQEYPLHHFTRRLWAWRQDWGSHQYWAQLLGRRVSEAGSHALWPSIATGIAAKSTNKSDELAHTD